MNTIYKVIWNDALRVFQVVNEITRSRKRACSVKSVHSGSVATMRRAAFVAGSALALLAASVSSAWADDYTFNGTVDLAGGSTNIETLEDGSNLPTADQSYVLDYSDISLSNASGIASFDETGTAGNLVRVPVQNVPLFPVGNVQVTNTPDGTYNSSTEGGRFIYHSQGTANFHFKLGLAGEGDFSDRRYGYIQLTRQLTLVDLLGDLSVEVGADAPDASSDNWTDLSSALTGKGNINFVFNGTDADVTKGYLYLNEFGANDVPDIKDEEKTSDYTGQTQVGVGGEKAVTVVFGKDNAFGNTSNLNVRADSEVWFADVDRNVHHVQTVGGLQGEGILNFGVGETAEKAAEVTLAQSSTTSGNVYVNADGTETFIGIDNRFEGSGGAVFNIELSDEVAGAEIFFTDVGSYSGLITLQDGVIGAYRDNRDLQFGDDHFVGVNGILNSGARLELLGNGILRVDETGRVSNLIVTGGDAASASFAFDGVRFGSDNALLSLGTLTLNQDQTTVSIESFAEEGALDDAAGQFENGSYLDADEGVTSALIHVEDEDFQLGDKSLVIGGLANSGMTTTLGDADDPTATLTWNFDEELRYEENDQTFYADYRLTKVDVNKGKTFELTSTETTGDEATFTAQITGSGGVTIDASGTEVSLGNADAGEDELNQYTGATTVTTGTTVTLVADNAMGQTSVLDNQGWVNLAEGVSQTIHDLTNSGGFNLASGSELFLDRDAAKGDITMLNPLSGTGTFKVDLGSNENELFFSGSQSGFDGTLSLSNLAFDLGEGLNQAVTSNAHVVLGESGFLTITGDAQFGSLTVEANAEDLQVENLVIGGAPSLSLDSGLELKGETTFDITHASVAEDADLLHFDRAQAGDSGASQDFVTTASGDISVANGALIDVTGANGYANNELVLDYRQSGASVAQTHWTVGQALWSDTDSLNAQILLTGIDVTGTLAFGESQTGTLSARLTSQGNAAGLLLTNGAAITVSGSNNAYSGAVTLEDAGTTLTLATGLGGILTDLSVGEGSAFTLSENVGQTTSSLTGTGTISLASGSRLSLERTGDTAVENAFEGSGTFAVDLNSGALTFKSNNAMEGRLALMNTFLTLADAGNQTVLGTASVQLGGGSRLESAVGSAVAGLEFSGGTVSLPSITAGDDAPLTVNGDVSFTSGGKIELDGLQVTGTEGLFDAFDLDQALIHFTGSALGYVAELEFGGEASGEIWNDGATPGADPAAYGVWTKNEEGLFIDGNRNISVGLELSELQLALDNGTGLVIDASQADGETITAAITDHGDTAGDITFTGSGTVTIGGTTQNKNTYMGETNVFSGARVELDKDNAFGLTSQLSVSDGAVDLNNHVLQVGALDLDTVGALVGAGTLTVMGTDGNSTISADNTGFEGNVIVSGGHTLTLQTAGGLGTNDSTITLTSNADTLQLSGVSGAGGALVEFGKTLSGAGALEVVNGSVVELTRDNASGGFTGAINIAAGASLAAIENADAKLGSGATVEVEGDLYLEGTGAWSIDDAFIGTGTAHITGFGEGASFAFTNEWTNPSDFTGTLDFTNIRFAVGGVNAANTANTTAVDAVFGSRSTLVVETGSEVNTFQDVTLSGGAVEFGGTLGFNASAQEHGTITIDGTLHLLEDTTLQVTIGSGDDMSMLAGFVDESELLTADKGLNPFEALITAEAIDGSGKVSLSTGNGSGAKQDIRDGNGDVVAYGIYNYQAALNDEENPTQVGVSYQLTGVDIVGGETLTLTGSDDSAAPAEIAVKLGESGGSGNLSIASGHVLLSYSGEEGNEYSGETSVQEDAWLAAVDGALGNTSRLVVKGTYENRGANTVGGLDVDSSGHLVLLDELTVDQDENGDSAIAGELTGTSTLVFNDGKLTIASTAQGNEFEGRIVAGNSSATNANLVIESLDAVNGSSALVFGNANSTIAFELNGAESSFASQIEGTGTIKADADFVFLNGQAALGTGSIFELTGTGVYDLSAGANASAGEKLDFIVNGGTMLANPDGTTRNVYGLQLAGGTLDFGEITHSGGQIHVGEGGLDLEGTTTVAFDTTDGQLSSVSVSDDGHELLAAGEVFSLDLITGLSGQSFTDEELNGHLALGEDFDDTTDVVTQNIGEGDESEVAILTRGSGAFHMSDDGDAIVVGYNYRELELIYGDETGENADKGLVVTNTNEGVGKLSAHIVGTGNLDLSGGAIEVGYANETGDLFNSYTGSTFVRDGADVTISETSGFGETKRLLIEEGGSVTLAAGKSQTVHGLEGTGDLLLGADSIFFLDWTSGGAHVVTNDIRSVAGASGGKLLMDGEGGSIAFGSVQTLTGLDLLVQNGTLRFENASTDNTYGTLSSAESFVLGTDAALTVNAGESGYRLNELVFGGFDETGVLTEGAGGSLGFTNVALSTEAGNDAVLHVDKLVVGTGGGSLSASAEIGSDFDVLKNDSTEYRSTLIAFDDYEGNLDALEAEAGDLDPSAIQNADGTTVAYAAWQTNGVETSVSEDQGDRSGTIGLAFQVSEIQLAAEGDSEGLVLNAEGSSGADATLSVRLTDYTDEDGKHAGNITFAGGDITLANTGDASDYTGKTFVTGGTVTLAVAHSFGNSSLLRVSNGASVDLGESGSESLGQIEILGENGLIGGVDSTLTLGFDGETATSIVTAANRDFLGDVTLTSGHTLQMMNAEGLGTSSGGAAGTVTVDDGATMVLAFGGTLSNEVAGDGTVSIGLSGAEAVSGNVTLDRANTGFAGTFDVLDGSSLTIKADATTAQDIFGSGTVVLGGEGSNLYLNASSGNISISNMITGNGTVTASGAGEAVSSLEWTAAWEDPDFTGELVLQNIAMSVGTTDETNALYTAHNLVNADVTLNAGSRLDVLTGNQAVDTFDALTIAGGSIAFDGTFDFGVGTDALGQLSVGSLVIDEEGGNLILSGIGTSTPSLQGTVQESELLADAQSVFQTLIHTESGVQGDLDNLTVNGSPDDLGGTKAINNDSGTVAYGHYDFGLDVSEDGLDLGVSFDLTQLDLVDGETLSLTGSDSQPTDLAARITSGGGLTIADGSVRLTHTYQSEDEKSNYTGETTVKAGASLAAVDAALGNTSWATVEDGGASLTLESGVNTVGGLTIAEGGVLSIAEDATLAVAHTNTSRAAVINGVLSGSGTLSVTEGSVIVSNANAGFTGVAKASGASSEIVIHDAGALGTSETNLSSGGTLTVDVDATSGATEAVKITNRVTGDGTVKVAVATAAGADPDAEVIFSFADDQASGAFTGVIDITDGGFSLAYEEDGDPRNDYTANQLAAEHSEIVVRSEGNLYVSTNTHPINRFYDKEVGALTLDGGNIYFGGLRYGATQETDNGGQLVLQGSAEGANDAVFDITTDSTVHLGDGATNSLSADGHELLLADDGTQIDIIQGADDIQVSGTSVVKGGDLAAASEAVDDHLGLALHITDSKQILTQNNVNVATVVREFGSGNQSEVFGVAGNEDGTYDVYLNYRVDQINLTYGDDANETEDLGLVISSNDTETGDDRATLTAQLTGGGNVIFAGNGEILLGRADATDDQKNNYTGKTWVTGGTIIFAEENAFGSSAVTVADGATVDLNGLGQTLPSLTAEADTLSGGGTYTLTGASGTSTISGNNPDFYGDFIVSGGDSGHTLRIESIGALGNAKGDDEPELTLEGENDKLEIAGASGDFTEVVKGDGVVTLVSGSNVVIAADNSGFSGTWSAASGTALTASGTEDGLGLDELLGSASISLVSGATVALSEEQGWTLQNAVEGTGGELHIDAAGGDFGFASDATTAGYEGDFIFTHAQLAVGGSSTGYVAENLQGNHSILSTGTNLTVSGNATVGALTLGESGSITFTEAFTPGETSWDSLLTVEGDLALSGGTIAITVGGLVDPLPSDDNAPLQSTDILAADTYEQYVTIAQTTSGGTVTGTASVTVNGHTGTESVEIQGVDGTAVADGTYGFNVQTSEDQTELQLGYGLTEVAIYGGKTLVLQGSTESGADNVLQAVVTDSTAEGTSGSGGIRIASGTVVLASSKNAYTGATQVASGATLAAEMGALGDTSDLVLEGDGATFENRGENTVFGIHAESGSKITLTGDLTAEINGGTESYINGNVEGDEKLIAQSTDGTALSIHGANTDWHGGMKIDGAVVTADDIASLGSGDVTVEAGENNTGALTYNLERADSVDGYTLANALTGDGDVTITIAEGEGSNVFAFSNEDGEHLTGRVTLNGVDLSLAEEDAGNRYALAGSTLALGAGSTLHVSDSVTDAEGHYDYHDRYLAGLALTGGSTTEFGGLLYGVADDNEMGGQLNLEQSGGGFGTVDLSGVAEGEFAKIVFKEGATNRVSEDGSEILSAALGAQIALVESAGDIVGRGGASVSEGAEIVLDDYLTLDLVNSDATQSLYQERDSDLVEVAEVTREFADTDGNVFGYADSDGHYDIYANYRITSLKLLDETPGEGLRVVNADEDPADLTLTVTGAGNIVLGGGIRFGNEENAYTGETIVESGILTAASDNAFGTSGSHTEAIVVENGASVDLSGKTLYTDRVETEAAGALTGGGSLTIGSTTGTGEASSIIGANADLSAAITVLDGHTVNLTDAGGLGSGVLALEGTLAIAGTPGNDYSILTNVLSGTGDVTVGGSAPADVLVDKENADFEGSWTAASGGTIRFDDGNGGAVSAIIGDASLEAETGGTIELVQAAENGRLEFGNVVTGEGTLHLEAKGDQADLVLGAAQSGFAGHYEFQNVSVDLAANGSILNQSQSTTLMDNSELHVAEGENTLTSDVTIEAGGALVYDGSLTPGSHAENQPGQAASHLTVDNLTLEAGAEVRVDVSSVPVDPSDGPKNEALSSQDVMDLDRGTNVSIIASAEGDGKVVDQGATLVDMDGNKLETVELNIVNTGDDQDHVSAVGHYGLGLDTDGENLELAYKLTQIDLKDGETLKLSLGDDDDTLSALLTSGGSFMLEKGDLTLTNGLNSYTGATIVNGDDSTHLTANKGALGDTSKIEVVNGTFTNAGDNVAGGVVVSASGALELANGTLTVNDTEAVESVISGSITGSGGFVLGSGTVLVASSNAGYEGAVSVNKDAHLTVKQSDSMGDTTKISVEGIYELDGVGADLNENVDNTFVGSGTISLTESNVTFTADNTGFEGGEFLLNNSDLTVNSAEALGLNTTVTGADSGGNTLHLVFADAAEIKTNVTGTVDVEKTGTGAISMTSFAADGTFTVKDGSVAFGSFGTENSASRLVVDDGKSASVSSSSFFETIELGAGSRFTASGDAPLKLAVSGMTSVGSGELHLGASGDNLKTEAIGTELETEGFSIDGGNIFLSGMLETGGWTVDHIVVNGTGTGTGTITVNYLDTGAGSVNADAWLVKAGEDGSLADLDLTLGNEDGVILAGGYEYHLLEADNGAGYYLHAFNKGTGDIDGNEIREPAAGAQAALLMASQTAFDLSLHDHIGNTPYVDQLTGEKKLTSLWILQRGDWSEWDDMSGQLSTDGKVMTTTIGGDVKSWVSDAGYQVHLGLLGAYAQADFDVKSDLDNRKAHGEFTGWSVGGYAAFQPAGMDGAFGSLQVRWNRFDNEAGPSGEAMHEYTSDGFSIQGELGYTKTLSSFRTFGGKTGYWRIEPHVRAHWNGVSADTTTDDAGRTYSVKGDGNIAVRVGFRSTLDVTHSVTPTYGDPTVRAYVEANYLRNTKQTSVTMTNDFRTSTVEYDNSDMAEFRFGLEGQFNRHLNLWGDVHHVTGDDAYNSTGVMLGLKYNF